MGLGAGALAAQAPEPMRFEVASVKPHPESGDTRVGIEENDGFVRIVNLPLRNIIAIAYDVMPDAVTGPGWLAGRRFDIVARPPEGYARAQMPTLLRNLLADRFMLVARRETREGAGYHGAAGTARSSTGLHPHHRHRGGGDERRGNAHTRLSIASHLLEAKG